MKKSLYIALNELLLLLKDRMAIVWMVILPLAMTAIMGLIFGGLGGAGEAAVIDLPVVEVRRVREDRRTRRIVASAHRRHLRKPAR